VKTENNQKLIGNLDAIGAAGAPDAAEAGKQALIAAARIDQGLDRAKNAAYAAVRDHSGQSATLDPEALFMGAEGRFEANKIGTVGDIDKYFPSVGGIGRIKEMYDELTTGKVPFTVENMQLFDKMLSRAQRGAEPSTAFALGQVRSALAETPVATEAGEQAIAAYNTAKGLARAQFALSDPKSQAFIPGYKAMLDAMGNASHDEFIGALEAGTSNANPEKWFTQQVFQASPSAVKKLVGYLGQDQGAVDAIQRGTLGEIRDRVVSRGDAIGRGVFSNAQMGRVMDRAATLREILPEGTVNTLGNLYDTSSRISGVPYKSAVNWSNTAYVAPNLEALKAMGSGVKAVAESAVGSIPVVGRPALAIKELASQAGKRRAQVKAVEQALTPSYATPGAGNLGRAAAVTAGVPLAVLAGSNQSVKP